MFWHFNHGCERAGYRPTRTLCLGPALVRIASADWGKLLGEGYEKIHCVAQLSSVRRAGREDGTRDLGTVRCI